MYLLAAVCLKNAGGFGYVGTCGGTRAQLGSIPTQLCIIVGPPDILSGTSMINIRDCILILPLNVVHQLLGNCDSFEGPLLIRGRSLFQLFMARGQSKKKSRVLYSELGEITGKTRVLPGGP